MKSRGPKQAPIFLQQDLSGLLSHLRKALAAVDRTVGFRLKGNFGLSAAGCTDSSEELPGTTGCILSCVTASFAALGLVLEAALSVEFLFTGGENELFTTLFAN